MRAIKTIAAILLFIIGFFLLICGIISFSDKEMGFGIGIFFLVISGLAVFFGIKLIKKPLQKSDTENNVKKKPFLKRLSESFNNWKEQVKKANEIIQKYKLQDDNIIRPQGDIFFIEYGDVKGDFSNRAIEIMRVYKRNKKLYIDAFCHMANDNRTFLVERIISMKKDDIIIEDVEAYLTDKYIMKP